MSSTLTTKLGVKPGMRAILLSAPKDVTDLMGSAELEQRSRLNGTFDYIHAFLMQQSELNDAFPRLKRHLNPGGMLWVSWPKNGQCQSDLTMVIIIRIGYDHGLVESKCVSVNSTWSGIKFTFPKAGKIYRNSYGKLKT
jgi:hypothetical protein